MTRAGFQPAIPAGERPQTHAFDCAATGIGFLNLLSVIPKVADGKLCTYIGMMNYFPFRSEIYKAV